MELGGRARASCLPHQLWTVTICVRYDSCPASLVSFCQRHPLTASRSCAWGTAKESAVLVLSPAERFPAGLGTVRTRAGRMTDDCVASSRDWEGSSLPTEPVAIAAVAELVDCLQIRLSHRIVCASIMTSRC